MDVCTYYCTNDFSQLFLASRLTLLKMLPTLTEACQGRNPLRKSRRSESHEYQVRFQRKIFHSKSQCDFSLRFSLEISVIFTLNLSGIFHLKYYRDFLLEIAARFFN